jgi:hypothetical protein
MSEKRLQKGPQHRPKTTTNQPKSAKSRPGATVALEAPERLPTFSRAIAQNKMRGRPGGLVGLPRGGERNLGAPSGAQNALRNALETPSGARGGPGVDFESILAQFWVEFGSIWGLPRRLLQALQESRGELTGLPGAPRALPIALRESPDGAVRDSPGNPRVLLSLGILLEVAR